MAIKSVSKSTVSNGKSNFSSSSSSPVVWEDAPKDFTKRSGVITEIWGPTGTGRTHLALTAPGPIAYLFFHEKADGVIQKFARQKEIRWLKCGGVFRGKEEDVQSLAWESMQEFESAYYDSFSWARTTIVDTHNEAWYLERLAEFGAPKPSSGRVDVNYASINNRWISMLNQARSQNHTNVIFIGQVEDEWKPGPGGFDKKTGKQVRISTSASNQVLLKSDVSIKTTKENGVFTATVYKGWFNAESEESELTDEMSTFHNIMGLITETDPDEWK